MTVSRPAQLSLFFSLIVALSGLPMRAQEPAAAVASESLASKPMQETTPRRPKVDDGENDRPARPRHKTAAKLAPVPAAGAATPKPGFFKRVFGPSKKPATPAPVATPTPKPKPKVKKDEEEEEVKPKPKKVDDEETKPKKPADKPEATPETPAAGDAGEPNLTAKSPKATPTKATPVPRGKKGAVVKETVKTPSAGALKEQAALVHAHKGGEADAIEKARYDYARARAVEDEHLGELKAKADAATSEGEGRKSLRAYNRALFEKMRKLEPTVSERIDRMEAAVLKRIGGEE